jgi:hypothetical protein
VPLTGWYAAGLLVISIPVNGRRVAGLARAVQGSPVPMADLHQFSGGAVASGRQVGRHPAGKELVLTRWFSIPNQILRRKRDNSLDQDGAKIIHIGQRRSCNDRVAECLEEPMSVIVVQTAHWVDALRPGSRQGIG